MKSLVKKVSLFVLALVLVAGFGIPASTVKAASPLDGTVLVGDTAFTMDSLIYCKEGDKVFNDFRAKLSTGANVYYNLNGEGWKDAFTNESNDLDVVFKGISSVNVEDQNGNITQCPVPTSTDDLIVTGIE